MDTGGRKRSVRETMDGHQCDECRRYFRVMEEQGLITSDAERKENLKKCSRHKSRCYTSSLRSTSLHCIHSLTSYLMIITLHYDLCCYCRWEAPATPEGFWDLIMQTPEEWSRTKKPRAATTSSSPSALSSAIGYEDDDCDG